MKDIPLHDVHNVVIMGHTGAGKTTLVDHILHQIGVAERAGSTADGTSFMDWTDEEKERQISVYSKPANGAWKLSSGKKVQLTLLDTPGYIDFFGQVVAASAVADSALIVVDATAGIQVGTNRAWKRAAQLKLPKAIVIAGIDKENADVDGTIAQIQEVWGSKCVPFSLPNADRSKICDILHPEKAPEDIAERVGEIKMQLVEAAAETDDSLIEKYLDGQELSADEIAAGLHDGVRTQALVPIFTVSTLEDKGIPELIDGITRFFPSPDEHEIKDAEGEKISTDPSAPFSGLVWRQVNDPYVGQLTFVRVYSGSLTPDTEIFNASRGHKERVGTIYYINGKTQDSVKEAHAGDIVAFAKLKDTHINDSVCAVGKTIHFPEIEFPKPVTSYAITSKKQGDEDKLSRELHRLAEEDPTIIVERNAETHEDIISGMGDIHLEIAVSKMKQRSNVEVNLETPKVAYRETVTATGEGHYRHKKQSGGRGQFGEVYLRVSQLPDGEDWFVNKIVGGAIPGNFIPAVQKGLNEGLLAGAVARYPVQDVQVTIYDGSYHDVDSSEVAFKIAASRAFREGMTKAKPVLLEPVMRVRVTVPEQFMGDVTGDLNHKRGRIQGMDTEDGMQVMIAEVPQAELFKYSSELRSMTGGRGTFEMEFVRYDVVPPNVAQKVVAEADTSEEED